MEGIKWRRTIYVRVQQLQLYEKLDKILTREGRSFSAWVLDQVQEYVRVHEIGNPQTLMTRYSDIEQSSLTQVCNYRGPSHPKKKLFLCQKDMFWKIPQACQNCRTPHTWGEKGGYK